MGGLVVVVAVQLASAGSAVEVRQARQIRDRTLTAVGNFADTPAFLGTAAEVRPAQSRNFRSRRRLDFSSRLHHTM